MHKGKSVQLKETGGTMRIEANGRDVRMRIPIVALRQSEDGDRYVELWLAYPEAEKAVYALDKALDYVDATTSPKPEPTLAAILRDHFTTKGGSNG
jgi:hypothetical protein